MSIAVGRPPQPPPRGRLYLRKVLVFAVITATLACLLDLRGTWENWPAFAVAFALAYVVIDLWNGKLTPL